MKKVIQDIWILKNEGTVMFQRVFDEKLDAQLFGSYMSALNMFATNLSPGGLSNFELGDKRFVFEKKDGILFITNSSPKMNLKDVQIELQRIIKKFFDTYGNEKIKNWDGNANAFDDFKQKIEDSLQDVLNNFNNAIW